MSEVDVVSVVGESVDRVPICQNLTNLSLDAEMREEVNVMEVMVPLCPVNVLARQGSRPVMSQT